VGQSEFKSKLRLASKYNNTALMAIVFAWAEESDSMRPNGQQIGIADGLPENQRRRRNEGL
jgi:hypothetical protein